MKLKKINISLAIITSLLIIPLTFWAFSNSPFAVDAFNNFLETSVTVWDYFWVNTQKVYSQNFPYLIIMVISQAFGSIILLKFYYKNKNEKIKLFLILYTLFFVFVHTMHTKVVFDALASYMSLFSIRMVYLMYFSTVLIMFNIIKIKAKENSQKVYMLTAYINVIMMSIIFWYHPFVPTLYHFILFGFLLVFMLFKITDLENKLKPLNNVMLVMIIVSVITSTFLNSSMHLLYLVLYLLMIIFAVVIINQFNKKSYIKGLLFLIIQVVMISAVMVVISRLYFSIFNFIILTLLIELIEKIIIRISTRKTKENKPKKIKQKKIKKQKTQQEDEPVGESISIQQVPYNDVDDINNEQIELDEFNNDEEYYIDYSDIKINDEIDLEDTSNLQTYQFTTEYDNDSSIDSETSVFDLDDDDDDDSGVITIQL